MKNNLTCHQTALFCSIIFLSGKLILLPALFFGANKLGGIFSLVLIMAIELVFLYVLLLLKKRNKNLDFYSTFRNKLGVVVTKIIFFILCVFFFLKFIYLLDEVFIFLKEKLYTNSTMFVYLICILPVVNALVYKGLQAFGRTLEIFYFCIISGIVICLVIWFISISDLSFLYFTNKGFSGFLNCIYSYSFWFCDFVFLYVIIKNVKVDSNGIKHIMRYSISTAFIIFIFFLAYFLLYQTASFTHTNAILDVIQFSSEIGNVGQLDLIPILVIMVSIFYQLGMFLYCCKDCLMKVIKFGHGAQPLIVINFITFILMYIIYNNPNVLNIVYSSDIISILALFVSFVLPLLFIIFIGNKKTNNCYVGYKRC